MYEGIASTREIPLTIKSVNYREGHTRDPTSGEKYLYGVISEAQECVGRSSNFLGYLSS